ncbi:MAG: hypothetical protein AAF673_03460, partial [Pseudomonadota bacterium]
SVLSTVSYPLKFVYHNPITSLVLAAISLGIYHHEKILPIILTVIYQNDVENYDYPAPNVNLNIPSDHDIYGNDNAGEFFNIDWPNDNGGGCIQDFSWIIYPAILQRPSLLDWPTESQQERLIQVTYSSDDSGTEIDLDRGNIEVIDSDGGVIVVEDDSHDEDYTDEESENIPNANNYNLNYILETEETVYDADLEDNDEEEIGNISVLTDDEDEEFESDHLPIVNPIQSLNPPVLQQTEIENQDFTPRINILSQDGRNVFLLWTNYPQYLIDLLNQLISSNSNAPTVNFLPSWSPALSLDSAENHNSLYPDFEPQDITALVYMLPNVINIAIHLASGQEFLLQFRNQQQFYTGVSHSFETPNSILTPTTPLPILGNEEISPAIIPSFNTNYGEHFPLFGYDDDSFNPLERFSYEIFESNVAYLSPFDGGWTPDSLRRSGILLDMEFSLPELPNITPSYSNENYEWRMPIMSPITSPFSGRSNEVSPEVMDIIYAHLKRNYKKNKASNQALVLSDEVALILNNNSLREKLIEILIAQLPPNIQDLVNKELDTYYDNIDNSESNEDVPYENHLYDYLKSQILNPALLKVIYHAVIHEIFDNQEEFAAFLQPYLYRLILNSSDGEFIQDLYDLVEESTVERFHESILEFNIMLNRANLVGDDIQRSIDNISESLSSRILSYSWSLQDEKDLNELYRDLFFKPLDELEDTHQNIKKALDKLKQKLSNMDQTKAEISTSQAKALIAEINNLREKLDALMQQFGFFSFGKIMNLVELDDETSNLINGRESERIEQEIEQLRDLSYPQHTEIPADRPSEDEATENKNSQNQPDGGYTSSYSNGPHFVDYRSSNSNFGVQYSNEYMTDDEDGNETANNYNENDLNQINDIHASVLPEINQQNDRHIEETNLRSNDYENGGYSPESPETDSEDDDDDEYDSDEQNSNSSHNELNDENTNIHPNIYREILDRHRDSQDEEHNVSNHHPNRRRDSEDESININHNGHNDLNCPNYNIPHEPFSADENHETSQNNHYHANIRSYYSDSWLDHIREEVNQRMRSEDGDFSDSFYAAHYTENIELGVI